MENLLDNNSSEMATIVETFLVEETAELIYDGEQLDKWNRIVDELGLQGQTQIAKKEKSPIPFMPIKTSLKNVFETLCPRKVDAKDYNVSPIPVEILDLMALSVNEGYFDKIQIWYDEKSPDPLCIGLKGDWYSYQKNNSSLDKSFKTEKEAKAASVENGASEKAYFIDWSAQTYLLGKWGDVKHSFKDLIKMATERFISEEGVKHRKAIKEAQRALDDLEATAFEKFGTDHSQNNDLPF